MDSVHLLVATEERARITKIVTGYDEAELRRCQVFLGRHDIQMVDVDVLLSTQQVRDMVTRAQLFGPMPRSLNLTDNLFPGFKSCIDVVT